MFEKLKNLFEEEIPQDITELLTSIEKSNRGDITRTFVNGHFDDYHFGEYTSKVIVIPAYRIGMSREIYHLINSDPRTPVEVKCSQSMKKKVYNALKTKSY